MCAAVVRLANLVHVPTKGEQLGGRVEPEAEFLPLLWWQGREIFVREQFGVGSVKGVHQSPLKPGQVRRPRPTPSEGRCLSMGREKVRQLRTGEPQRWMIRRVNEEVQGDQIVECRLADRPDESAIVARQAIQDSVEVGVGIDF